MEPVQGDQWPEARSDHSTCVLNYGEGPPIVLVSGGMGKGLKVLGDMWILDVDSGKWTEVRMLVCINYMILCDFRLCELIIIFTDDVLLLPYKFYLMVH